MFFELSQEEEEMLERVCEEMQIVCGKSFEDPAEKGMDDKAERGTDEEICLS